MHCCCSPAPLRSQQQQATAQNEQQVPLAFIKLAHDLADAAGKVTSQYFRSSTLNVDSKSDASPVTIADKQAEDAMRQLIKSTVPQHSVFGEEHGLELGASNGSSDSWLWVLDPIDGTKSFITGVCVCVHVCARLSMHCVNAYGLETPVWQQHRLVCLWYVWVQPLPAMPQQPRDAVSPRDLPAAAGIATQLNTVLPATHQLSSLSLSIYVSVLWWLQASPCLAP